MPFIVEFGLTMMQSVVESWTHNANPAFCLLSDAQIEEMKKEGVNEVMKQMIRKYLRPTSTNNGVKRVIIRPDAGFFDKLVGEGGKCDA